jgi:hypothetical protein
VFPGRPPPDWLLDLPLGLYSLAELVQITGRKKSTISETMRRYDVHVFYEARDSDGRVEASYDWKGYLRGVPVCTSNPARRYT